MTSWRLWASTASLSPRTKRVPTGRPSRPSRPSSLARVRSRWKTAGVDAGRQGLGGRAAEHLDLVAQVEDDHRVDRPRAVEPGHADDPVPLRDQPLGGGDQRGHLDLAGPGHRHVGDADDLAVARPSPRGPATAVATGDQDHPEADVLDQVGQVLLLLDHVGRQQDRPRRRPRGRSRGRGGPGCGSGCSRVPVGRRWRQELGPSASSRESGCRYPRGSAGRTRRRWSGCRCRRVPRGRRPCRPARSGACSRRAGGGRRGSAGGSARGSRSGW